MGSVERALHLLDTVSAHPGSGVSELSVLADLTLNQTFRLLLTLESAGYIQRSENKTYRLGTHAALLGQSASWFQSLVSAAGPQMDELADLSGETILLATRERDMRVVIDRRISRHSLRVQYPVGSKVPLTVGGLGPVLLAYAPAALQEALLDTLKPLTPHTLTAPALRKEMARIRTAGFRVSREDYSLGEFSVAAPILDSKGQAIAAMNIAGFTARLDDATTQRYVAAVKNAAQQTASNLGGR